MIIPSLIMCVALYLVRRAFVNTSRPLMRMQGMAKAPVFSQVSATMQGLESVRTFGAQDILVSDFDKQQVAVCFCPANY